MLAVPTALIPPAVIGVLRPLSALEPDISVRLALPGSWRERDLDDVDVVVFCRNNDDRSVELLEAARRRGIPTIYEIDDDLFELPAELPGVAGLTQARSLRNVLSLLRGCTRVHTYSALMMERLVSLGVVAHRAPVYFDHGLVADVPSVPAVAPRLVFASGRMDEPELDDLLLTVVDDLLERRPDAEVHLWRDPGRLAGRRGVVRHPPGVVYSEFVQDLARLGSWVGLAPLSSSTYYQAKTNNKFREYAGCGIAGIYSDVPVYRECVVDGVTGLLVPNTVEAWVDAALTLMERGDLRRSIVAAAGEVSRRDFSPSVSTRFWTSALADVQGSVPAAEVLAWEGEPARVLPGGGGSIEAARDVVHVAAVLRGPVVARESACTTIATVATVEQAARLGSNHAALVVDLVGVSDDRVADVCAALPVGAVAVVSQGARPHPITEDRPHPWLPRAGSLEGRRVVWVDPDRHSVGIDSWGYGLGYAYDEARSSLSQEPSSAGQPVGVRAVILAARSLAAARAVGLRVVRLLREPPAVSLALLRSRRLARSAPRRWNEQGLREL